MPKNRCKTNKKLGQVFDLTTDSFLEKYSKIRHFSMGHIQI